MTSRLWFGLLGELEVRRGSERIPVGRSTLRILLATLLLDVGRTVPYGRLVDALWGADPPSSARSTVHVYANRLRRLLGDDGPEFRVLHTRPNGYLLDVDRDQVDVARFADGVRRARQAEASGDIAGESQLLTTALDLWRGTPLADVDSEALQHTVVPRLVEDRLQALERRVEVDLELGRGREVLGELADLTTNHPARERFRTLQMRALLHTGRRAEALEVYQDLWRHLRDELGIEPGEEIRQLHAEALAGADDGAPGEGGAADEATAPAVRPAQLPPDRRRFAGRTAHVAEVTARLRSGSAPPTIVCGPPGVGKTAFAVHVAHAVRAHFPDGQLYADLGGHSTGGPSPCGAVLQRFLRALGVVGSQLPADPADQIALYRSLLADRRVLVVLDNAAGPDQVRPLLPGRTGCAALVTSRNELRGLVALDGAEEVVLEPMDQATSREVLAGVIPARRLAAEPDAAAELATLCAGLPLALRIAAANVRAHPGWSLADHVSAMRRHGRLAHLRVPGDEQAAVRAAFDLSYARLAPDVARLFRLLGVVPGPDVTTDAAAALAGCDTVTAAEHLDDLLAANLLTAGEPGRFRLHDLVREYARSRADEDPETREAEDRLWDHFLDTARAAADVVHPDVRRVPPATGRRGSPFPGDEAAALEWLDQERSTLVAMVLAAGRRGRNRYAWLIADALGGYFWTRGHGAEGLTVCEAALAAARAQGDRRAEARVLNLTGLTQFALSRFQDAEPSHLCAWEISREIGDREEELSSLYHLGRVAGQLGPAERSAEYHEQALELARELGDRDAQALNTNYIGVARLAGGRADLALEEHRRALALAGDNDSVRARILGALGNAALYRGELATAVARYVECLEIARRLGNRGMEANALICLGETRCDTGEYDLALEAGEQALQLGRRLGEPRHEVGAVEVLATARFRSGRTDGVLEDYRAALATAQAIGFRFGEVSIRCGLAAAHRGLGDPAAASTEAERALETMASTGMWGIEARAHIEAGRALGDLGELDRARGHFERALLLAERSGLRLVDTRAREALAALEAAAAPPAAHG